MVVIRLARGGAHKRPSYKVVVADSRKPRNGRFVEYIGYCKIEPGGRQPRSDVNLERYNYWCSVGAKPSHAVRKLVRLKLRGGNEDKTVVMETPAEQSAGQVAEKPSPPPVAAPSEAKPEEPQASAEPDVAAVAKEEPAGEPASAAGQEKAVPAGDAAAAPAQQDAMPEGGEPSAAAQEDATPEGGEPSAAAQEDSAGNVPEPSSEKEAPQAETAEKPDSKPV